jgi:membrane protein YdbS with pleckstrin-like domain
MAARRPIAGELSLCLTHTQVPWYLWNSAIVAVLAAAATLAVAPFRRRM